jgi:diadenosine tetraphosphate (Ap4A) HIT family hydrolase
MRKPDETQDALLKMAKPLTEFLKQNYNPHCQIVINENRVEVVETVSHIPIRGKAHSEE